ncbi:hypothetical protein BpHYR1_027816 [Brachionus plicatilis]|uniref:Uncharacterized protein n=1 Tax=Brachionus plicatilis TaxID=10195 RepID=A0A3M7S492_BRAPC|nr:hypothetical protein BpHYR1_027816 [Brachionus plicatilis]
MYKLTKQKTDAFLTGLCGLSQAWRSAGSISWSKRLPISWLICSTVFWSMRMAMRLRGYSACSMMGLRTRDVDSGGKQRAAVDWSMVFSLVGEEEVEVDEEEHEEAEDEISSR